MIRKRVGCVPLGVRHLPKEVFIVCFCVPAGFAHADEISVQCFSLPCRYLRHEWLVQCVCVKVRFGSAFRVKDNSQIVEVRLNVPQKR